MVTAAAVALSLAAAPGARPVAAQGGVRDHPAEVFAFMWHYISPAGIDKVVIHQGQHLSFGNYDPIFGIPAHSLDEVVRDCTSPPFNGNDLGQGHCGYPRFSSGLVDHGYVHEVEGVDKLPPGTYYFTCEVHPFMHGTLIVEP